MLYTKPYVVQLENEDYAVLMGEYYVSAPGFGGSWDEQACGEEIELHALHICKEFKDEYFDKIPFNLPLIAFDDYTSDEWNDAVEQARYFHNNRR